MRWLLCFVVLYLPTLICYATPFTLTEIHAIDNIQYIELSGNFDHTTYKKIHNLLDIHKNKNVVFYVRSSGGRADKLASIMDDIRAHKRVHWVVPSHSYCYSACAWSGIAAAKITGKLKFHGVRDSKNRLSNSNMQLQLKVYQYGYGFNRSARWVQKDYYEEVFE